MSFSKDVGDLQWGDRKKLTNGITWHLFFVLVSWNTLPPKLSSNLATIQFVQPPWPSHQRPIISTRLNFPMQHTSSVKSEDMFQKTPTFQRRKYDKCKMYAKLSRSVHISPLGGFIEFHYQEGWSKSRISESKSDTAIHRIVRRSVGRCDPTDSRSKGWKPPRAPNMIQ